LIKIGEDEMNGKKYNERKKKKEKKKKPERSFTINCDLIIII